MYCVRAKPLMLACAILALSCLGCHKVRSVNQLLEPNIKYQALAERTLVVGATSRVMIARTRSSGTVRINEAASREPEVVAIKKNHGHFIEVEAKSAGSTSIIIDASSPEGADRRFVVTVEVHEAKGIQLSYCGASTAPVRAAYIKGYPARVHYTYYDDLGPIRGGRASGVWPTPPSVLPADAARPSALEPRSQEFLFDIPASRDTPFELVSPFVADGKAPAKLEIMPVSIDAVDALRLGLSPKQSVDQVQPLEVSFLIGDSAVCSLLPLTIKSETPERCELLLHDGSATHRVDVSGAKMPWVRLVSAGICEISVSATLPALEQGGEPRVFSDRAEIKGYLPSDNLPR